MTEQIPWYEERTFTEGRPQDHSGVAIPFQTLKTEKWSPLSIRHDLQPLVTQPGAQPCPGAGTAVDALT